MNSPDSAAKFIEDVLLGADNAFAARNFEASATIYRVRLQTSFVAALINGAEEEVGFWGPAGRNRYSELLRRLGQLTSCEPCFWFYVCDSLDGLSQLGFVRAAKFEPGGDFLDVPLAQFETEPAPIGGGAYLGLLAASGKWLLLHTHYAEQEFEISVNGPSKLCDDLCRLARSTSCAVE